MFGGVTDDVTFDDMSSDIYKFYLNDQKNWVAQILSYGETQWGS
jgi:hypothetical protein